MKKTIFAALAAAGLAAFANPPGFTDDYNEALARAAREEKAVLAVFSGSDWCGWCIKLDDEFLSKPEFTKAVEKDLVLLYVDMPRDTSRLNVKAASVNPKLVKRYGIKGFPSLRFLDGRGRVLGVAERDMSASPGEWGRALVAEAKRLLAKRQ